MELGRQLCPHGHTGKFLGQILSSGWLHCLIFTLLHLGPQDEASKQASLGVGWTSGRVGSRCSIVVTGTLVVSVPELVIGELPGLVITVSELHITGKEP